MKTKNIALNDMVLLIYRMSVILYCVIAFVPCNINCLGYSINLLLVFYSIYCFFQFALLLLIPPGWLKSIVGQIGDLLLLAAWLYTKQTLDIYAISFIVLLLLCKDYSNDLILRLVLFIGIPLLLLLYNEYDNWKIFLPFLFYLLFTFANYQAYKMGKDKQRFLGMIDELFLKSCNKPYRLYLSLKSALRKLSLPVQVEDIYCFRWSQGHFYIVNGTAFVWNYEILEQKNQLNKIFASEFYPDLKIKINQYEEDNFCFVVHPNHDECVYLYVLVCDKKPFYYDYYVQILLKQFFYRLSRIQEADWNFRRKQIEELSALGKKMNYVNASMNTLHFIRNKLSPLKNYIAMYGEYAKGDKEQRDRIQPYLDRELDNIKRSFELINNRANNLLEEQQNPFVYSSTKKYGLQQLFAEIKKVWQTYSLNEDNILVRLQPKVNGQHKSVYYNVEGLILVLDNWMANIVKHGLQDYKLEIIENETMIIVQFSNHHKMKDNDCNHIISIFNNNNRFEINKRNYHGLQVIKDVLTQMKINSELSKQNDNLVLKLELFKQVEDVKNEENTSN